MKTVAVAAVMIMCMLPGPAASQGLKGLFNDLKKAVTDKVDETITEKVEGPCIQKEDNAKVDDIDTTKTGTWIVEATDGRKFQVSDLVIAGVTEDGINVAPLFSMAEAVSFSLVAQDRLTKTYQVHVDYAPLADSGSGVRGLLGSIANNVAQSSMKNDFKFTNVSFGGSAVDGRDWCLNIPTNTISRITLVKN